MTIRNDLSLFEQALEPNPYEKYYLLENPFPGYGETDFDVCADQETTKREFVDILKEFSSEAKRLRINGKNGAGKTNILRYFEKLTNEARRSGLVKNLHPIYVQAPGESYFDIHGQIVDKLSEFFLGDMLAILKQTPKKIDTLSSEIRQASELLEAIKALVKGGNTLFTIYDERQEDAFIRWLKGQKLLVADKKLLTHDGTPSSDITSPSLAMRFLGGLLTVLKELDLCDGIVLLFDEFEEIFEGLPRSRQSRYAQDLRHFFDTLKESVFFVIATVPEPKDLGQYPAIERRLGNTVDLQPIDNPELALAYVSNYMDNGRDKYETYLKETKKSEKTRPQKLEPLREKDVQEVYSLLKKEVEEAELDVLPGYFLPKMRERMKQTVENGDG